MTAIGLGRRDYAKGVAAMLLATLFWSLSGLFMRIIPQDDVWRIAAWRSGCMSLGLLLFLLTIYGRGTLAQFRAIDRSALLGAAGFFAVGSTLYIVALSLAGTANVACLSNLTPIFAPLLARLVLGERSGPAIWIATALAIAGVFVVFGTDFGQGSAIGNALSLVVAFCFAAQTVWLRRYRDIDLVPAVCLGGLVVFVGVGLVRGGLAISWEAFGWILLMGFLQLALPLILYTRAARWAPAIQMTLIALLDVVLNPFWTWLVVDEVPAMNAIWGGLLILVGVLISVIAGRKPQASAPAPAAAIPEPVGER
jgi:drug/metabolite transporter (DMT)-like permease